MAEIIKEPFKRCLIITNYRVGSTYFIRKNAEHHGVTCGFEYVNDHGYSKALHFCKNTPNWIIKVMPDQLKHNIKIYETIIQYTDKIVYLYRQNFTAQAKSWIAMNKLGDWGETRQHPNDRPLHHNVNVDQNFCDKWTKILIDNYNSIQQIYKRYPGDIHCFEDFTTYLPYKRIYNWNYEPRIPHYDVENIFKEQ